MKPINGKPYLEYSEIEACGITTEKYLTVASTRKSNAWDFEKDPDDGRKTLVGYEALRPVYKKLVVAHFKMDPYDYIAKRPILDMVGHDWRAEEWYRTYRYGEKGLNLTPYTVKCYVRAVGWLMMMIGVLANKSIVKKGGLNISMDDFWKHVQALINIECERDKKWLGAEVLDGTFPASKQRLVKLAEKYRSYAGDQGDKSEAYKLLIHPHFGNQYAVKWGKPAKITEGYGMELGPVNVKNGTKSVNKGGGIALITKDDCMAMVRSVSGFHNNLPATQVAKHVNSILAENGLETMSVAAYKLKRKEFNHIITAGSKGRQTFDNTIARQMKRQKNPNPMAFWTQDGWTAELMYQERVTDSKGNSKMAYKRMDVVVVLDTANDYIVGYAIGTNEDTELIRDADRDALRHVRELFGDWYEPWQLQTDNYQKKNLTPFYESMTHLYTPAAVGNAKAKPIERFFARFNDEYCRIQMNWTGHNVNANRNNQVNREMTDKIKNSFPDKAGVIRQIEKFIAQDRAKKIGEYMARWAAMPDSDKKRIDEVNLLMIYGRELPKTTRMRGEGFVKAIKGMDITYDTFDPTFRQHMHIDWTVKVDDADLSRILVVSPDQKMRYILDRKRIVPIDVRRMTQEDWDEKTQTAQYNKVCVDEITAQSGKDMDITRQIVLDTYQDTTNADELALKMRLTYAGQQKQPMQKAKGLDVVQKKENKRLAQVEEDKATEWEAEQQAYRDKRMGSINYQ